MSFEFLISISFLGVYAPSLGLVNVLSGEISFEAQRVKQMKIKKKQNLEMRDETKGEKDEVWVDYFEHWAKFG